jgi:hypothetical protein
MPARDCRAHSRYADSTARAGGDQLRDLVLRAAGGTPVADVAFGRCLHPVLDPARHQPVRRSDRRLHQPGLSQTGAVGGLSHPGGAADGPATIRGGTRG